MHNYTIAIRSACSDEYKKDAKRFITVCIQMCFVQMEGRMFNGGLRPKLHPGDSRKSVNGAIDT